MNDVDQQEVIAAVEAAMRSFEAAERNLDAERLIVHLAPVPGFHVYDDGQRLEYEALTTNLRTGFSTLRSIEGGFHDMQVIVLAPDAALATAGFREVVTDASGGVVRLRGAASWLWRRIGADWRIVCGHADHYPDEPGQ